MYDNLYFPFAIGMPFIFSGEEVPESVISSRFTAYASPGENKYRVCQNGKISQIETGLHQYDSFSHSDILFLPCYNPVREPFNR